MIDENKIVPIGEKKLVPVGFHLRKIRKTVYSTTLTEEQIRIAKLEEIITSLKSKIYELENEKK
jgi:hypothetical protein